MQKVPTLRSGLRRRCWSEVDRVGSIRVSVTRHREIHVVFCLVLRVHRVRKLHVCYIAPVR